MKRTESEIDPIDNKPKEDLLNKVEESPQVDDRIKAIIWQSYESAWPILIWIIGVIYLSKILYSGDRTSGDFEFTYEAGGRLATFLYENFFTDFGIWRDGVFYPFGPDGAVFRNVAEFIYVFIYTVILGCLSFAVSLYSTRRQDWYGSKKISFKLLSKIVFVYDFKKVQHVNLATLVFISLLLCSVIVMTFLISRSASITLPLKSLTTGAVYLIIFWICSHSVYYLLFFIKYINCDASNPRGMLTYQKSSDENGIPASGLMIIFIEYLINIAGFNS